MATMSARYTVIDGEVIAQERGGVRHQLVPDPLGSTIALYDDSGIKTDTFEYWPYGESAARTGMTVAKFQYVGSLGYYQSNAIVDYVRARYLNKISGKWVIQDPLGHFDDLNLYSYCRMDPVTTIDPSGLFSKQYWDPYVVNCTDNSGKFTGEKYIILVPPKTDMWKRVREFYGKAGIPKVWWGLNNQNKQVDDYKRNCDDKKSPEYHQLSLGGNFLFGAECAASGGFVA